MGRNPNFPAPTPTAPPSPGGPAPPHTHPEVINMTLAVAYLLLEALRDAVKQYGGGERQGLEALEKYMTGVFGESWGTECAAGIDMVLKVLQASGELDFGNRRVDGGLDDTVKTGPALETSV